MCENNITNKKTPLRNSRSANKPFRSPLTTVVTPKNDESPKNVLYSSPIQKSTTPKRTLSQFCHPIKRRRIDVVLNDCEQRNENEDGVLTHRDLLASKRRICRKKQELEDLKRKLNYIKKHKSEDLAAQINRWRSACKEALFNFHKGIREKTSESTTMRQVLAMLGIPEDVVKFTDEECDLD